MRDLLPEAPVQTGTIRTQYAQKVSLFLEEKIYQAAQKVVALSPGMRNYIEKIVPEKEIHLIPNFADIDFFKKDPLCKKSCQKPCHQLYWGAWKSQSLRKLTRNRSKNARG